MSLTHHSSTETIDLTMEDELDVMIASSPVIPRTLGKLDEGRALRPRQSLGNNITIPNQKKRLRRMSDSTVENHEQRASGKKLKMEDKKSVR